MPQVTFTDYVFRERHRVVDIVSSATFAGLLGYFMQAVTFSEFEDPGYWPTLGAAVGIVSFLGPGVFRYPIINTHWPVPGWVWVAGIGTALFEAGHGLVLYAWKSVRPDSNATALEQMLTYIDRPRIGEVVFMYLLFLPMFLLVLFTARVAAFLIRWAIHGSQAMVGAR